MNARVRTKTRDIILSDELRESPVDRELMRGGRRLLVLLVLAAALVVGGVVVWGPAPSASSSQRGSR